MTHSLPLSDCSMSNGPRIRRFDGTAIPAGIISGPGSRSHLPDELDGLGLQRALVVSGPTLRAKTGFVDEIAEHLGRRLVGIYDEVEPNAPESAVRRASDYARQFRPDVVISIGGGAVHDTAKAIAVMVPSSRSITDFVSRFEPPDTFHSVDVDLEPLPVFTIPSTFSAADVVGGGAVTDTDSGEKLIFVHPKLTPVRVFLDGEVVATTPRGVLVASGMNAVHHCLEAFYSKGHQPITDAFALTALARLLCELPKLAPDAPEPSVETFQAALTASSMSGLTYANSWLGIGHAVCHSLGGRYGLSHGAANSVMVRHSLRFNQGYAAARLAQAARAVGASSSDAPDDLAARRLVATVDWLADRLAAPQTLREIGLPAGQFEQIARDVMSDPQTYWNPRPATFEEVVDLVRAAW